MNGINLNAVDWESVDAIICFIVLGGLAVIAWINHELNKNKYKYPKRSIVQYRKIQ
jgi:hypothetical protein